MWIWLGLLKGFGILIKLIIYILENIREKSLNEKIVKLKNTLGFTVPKRHKILLPKYSVQTYFKNWNSTEHLKYTNYCSFLTKKYYAYKNS